MTEIKEKKLRIVKVAADYNLSADALLEFLKKKGFEVKTINSVVNEEMEKAIHDQFKKDIEKAEKHYKKIDDIKKKLADKGEKAEKEAPGPEKPATKTTKKQKEKEAAPAPAEPVVTEPQPIAEAPEPPTPEHTEPVSVPEAAEEAKPVAEPAPAPEPEATKPFAEDKTEDQAAAPPVPVQPEPVAEQPKKQEDTFLSPSESIARRKFGLTVVGKVTVDAAPEKVKKDVPGVSAASGQAATEAKGESDSAKANKKKKKKPKAKKVESAPVEDTAAAAAKKKVKPKKFEINESDVKEAIRKTLLSMDDAAGSARAISRKRKKKERLEEEEKLQEIRDQEKHKLKVTEFIAVNELANLMGVNVSEVIQKCIGMGMMVSINQRLDIDTITLVADEFNFEVEIAKEYTAEVLEDIADNTEDLVGRPPVVTIMGHVDHGKTSLLDYIRRTNVVAGESGGITQHIGAYKVEIGNGKTITFLDTPGHEAFTAMRARGAQITDIVVLVVAADDAVMPQTVEAINHAKAANVPIIVAINKIDKPGANIDRIRQQLGERNILVEEWGGKYQAVELSAKTGVNVDVLLEKILLEADLLDLKANPDRKARGVIIESELDKGRGITATVLVQKGTLHIGDPFVAGIHHGRVRAMFDERNKKVALAPPGTPVLVTGLEGAPQAGDLFICVASEREAREIAIKRQQLKREQDNKQVHHLTLDDISEQIKIGGVKELPVIVKGDVDGSVEALADSLMKLSSKEVIVRVIHRGVGAISEGDVLLADASNAIIVGFHVRPHLNARKLAESQKVDIRIYNVIYDAINEVRSALEGLLSPVVSEEVTATLEIRDTFKVPKFGTVAGCYVQDGKIIRNNKVRIIRDGIVLFDGEIGTLKRFKDDVREVDAGYECGLNINNFNDIKPGDIIEAYKLIETKKKL